MKTHSLLLAVALALLASTGLTGCADEFFGASEPSGSEFEAVSGAAGPVSAKYSKLRHPQMLEQAKSVRSIGKTEGDEVADYQLVVSYDIYEADGVTRRMLNKYDVTRRVLNKYGVTRRILKKYERCDEGGWEDEDECEFTPLRLRLYDEILGGISVEISDFYLDSLLSYIQSDPDLAWVDPDWLLNFPGATIVPDDTPSSQVVPWSIDRIGSQLATYNAGDVHVYLLDSGVYARDLNLQTDKKDFTVLFENRDQEFIDEEELLSEPVYDPKIKGNPSDGSGHGTHAAGVIGGKDNAEGILGVVPDIKLHNYKVLTENGQTDVTTVVAAVNYITNIKLDHPERPMVVNLSLGADIGTTFYNVLDEAIERSIEVGVVYVVSAGNDGADASTYSPAHVAGAITVGAHDELDTFAGFSNHGSVVDILAPGVEVPSLAHSESMAEANIDTYMSGTSTAAPHVAGAAAIYLAIYPDASPAEVRNALVNFAQPVISGVPGSTTNKTVYVADFAYDPGAEEELKISKAEWKKDLGLFIVEGTGIRLEQVKLLSAGIDDEIDRVDADIDGNWSFIIDEVDLAGVPCAIIVEQSGDELAKDVRGRPYDCVTALNLVKAEWDGATRKLLLEGEGVSGQTITFKSALLNTVFASVVVNEVGEFQTYAYTIEDYLVPCVVTAFIGTVSADKQVSSAPDICDYGRYNDEEDFVIDEAKWEASTSTLILRGKGAREAVIRTRTDGTLTSISETTVFYDGIWNASVVGPARIPCEVIVESEGVSLTKSVSNAPDGCEAAPALTKAEWNGGLLKIEATGTAGFATILSSVNTGAVLDMPLFGSDGRIVLEIASLETIPCSVRLEAEGLVDERAVKDAPVGCDDMAYVRFDKANWEVGNTRLVFEGEAIDQVGSETVTVTIRNATTGQIIGTASTDIGHKAWELRVEDPADVPCSVTAELDGTVKGLAVEHAPMNCDAGRGPMLKFGKAEWLPVSATVQMQGKANPFTQVTLRKQYNNSVMAIVVSDAYGLWNAEVSVGDIPCSARADTEAQQAVRELLNAPKSCR